MTPQQLIEGLDNLQKSLNLTVCAFRVPTIPHFQPSSLRQRVTASDLKELVEYVRRLEREVEAATTCTHEVHEQVR